MDFDALRAAVVPGDGVVGRWPGLVCVADCADRAVLRRLLDVCAGTAGPDPGRTLARRLAMWLGGPDAPKADLRFGTVAITGDQWAVFLFGSVGLVVPESGIELSGAHAATWTDRLLPRQATPGVLVLEGGRVPSDLVDGVHDLRSGVVPGAGAVLVHARRSTGGDSSEEVASRTPVDSAWPDLNDVPVELERSPWNMTDSGTAAAGRAGSRRSGDLSANHSPVWNGVLGGSDVLGGELLSGDIEDTRSGGGGSATARAGSGSINGAWPGVTTGARRAGAERPGSTSAGARRGRGGRVGAGRGGPGANGSVLRAVGSRDFELLEAGGSIDGERADETGGRAENDAPSGGGSGDTTDARSGAAVREAHEDSAGDDSRGSAAAEAVGLGSVDRLGADRVGADRTGADRRNGAEAGTAGAGGVATRAAAGRAGPETYRAGSERSAGDRSGGDKPGAVRSDTGQTGRAATGSTESRAAEPQRPPNRGDSDSADAQRRASGAAGARGGGAAAAASGGTGSGRAAASGADAGRAGMSGADSGRPAAGAGDSRGAGPDRAGQGRAAAASASVAVGNGERAASGRADAGRADAGGSATGGADKGRAGAERAGSGSGGVDRTGTGRATADRARPSDSRAVGAASGSGTNGAAAGRAGSGGTGVSGAGSNVADGAGPNRAGPNGAGPVSASSGGAAAARRPDRSDAGRGAAGQVDPRRDASGGSAANNGVGKNGSAQNSSGQNGAQSRSGTNDAAAGGTNPDRGGPGAGGPGEGDTVSDDAAPGGGLAAVAQLVPRDQGREDATGGSGVASVHPLAPDPSRRRANGGQAAVIQSDAWFAAASDVVAEPDAAPRGGPRHGRQEEDGAGGRAAPAAAGTSKPSAAEQTQLQAVPVLGVVPPERSKQQAETGTSGDAPAGEARPSGAESPQVRGHLCPSGHLNDPRAQLCLSCGARVEERGGALVSGPRPSLGTLIFDDGATHSVDSDYLVGRMPEADPRVRAGSLRSLLVEDPSGAVSRAHAEIRINGWDVLLVDSGSRNGTFVAGPGESAWTALPPRQSRWLVPGTRVRLGGRTFLFEAPPGVR